MARLNDPPVPAAESLDALKRRFIRQNREIARVNSNQSQRIRNLETEISRLLAENIALREQAIRANEEAEQLKTSNRLCRDVLILRERLASKLQEAGALVEELGALPEKAARRSSFRRRKSGVVQSLITSPDVRQQRARQNMGTFANPELDGRLPAILEDKYYPRRTLESAELRRLSGAHDEDVESPDLGPPPTVHFDVNEPIIFDHTKSPIRVSDGIVMDEEVMTLPSSLETRRKRRTSSLLQEISVLNSVSELTTNNDEERQQATKPGSKRKVDAYELDEHQRPGPEDEFVFHRKSSTIASERPRPSRFTARAGGQSRAAPGEATASPLKTTQPSRQALAPKTTNSPVKRKIGSASEKRGIGKDLGDAEKPPRRVATSSRAKIEPPSGIMVPCSTELGRTNDPRQPKTPAAELAELLSPSSVPTEPSTKAGASTISEVAITNSVEDVLNGSIGRGSRRVRAAVSYAEPNLRDKMRRPDKKLVGAVEGLNKPLASDKDSAKAPAEDGDLLDMVRQSMGDAEFDKLSTHAMNRTQRGWNAPSLVDTRDACNEEAVSPLKDKARKQIEDRRHKRTFSEAEAAGFDTTTPGTTHDSSNNQNFEQRSIFDPPTSSPVAAGPNADDPHNSKPSQRSSITSRKVSMANPTSTAGLKTRRHSIQGQQSVLGEAPARSGSALSSRDVAREGLATRLKRPSSVQTLPRPFTTSAVSTQQNVEPANGRAMSTRRRSMMV